MPELENMGDELTVALGNAVAAGIKQLLSFRTFCGAVDIVAGIVGGWARPLLYRDAGERALRTWPLAFLLGWLVWGAALIGLSILASTFSIPVSLVPGPVAQIAVVWAAGLGIADWIAAMQRRKERVFVYSRFLGWPRWAKSTPAGYRWQPVILAGIGLVLLLTPFDRGAGVLFLGAAAAFGLQLWSIAAVRRENALDQRDAAWMASYQREAVQELDASEEVRDFGGVAQAVTTADLIRHMGTTF